MSLGASVPLPDLQSSVPPQNPYPSMYPTNLQSLPLLYQSQDRSSNPANPLPPLQPYQDYASVHSAVQYSDPHTQVPAQTETKAPIDIGGIAFNPLHPYESEEEQLKCSYTPNHSLGLYYGAPGHGRASPHGQVRYFAYAKNASSLAEAKRKQQQSGSSSSPSGASDRPPRRRRLEGEEKGEKAQRYAAGKSEKTRKEHAHAGGIQKKAKKDQGKDKKHDRRREESPFRREEGSPPQGRHRRRR